jgi:hypothetical protein
MTLMDVEDIMTKVIEDCGHRVELVGVAGNALDGYPAIHSSIVQHLSSA